MNIFFLGSMRKKAFRGREKPARHARSFSWLFLLLFFLGVVVITPVQTEATSQAIINVPLEIVLEQETAAAFPQYKTVLTNLISQVNSRAAKANINRRFYIKQFDAPYSRETWKANKEEVPDYFFTHDKSVVYVAVDSKVAGASQTYYWLPSVIIHGSGHYSPFWNVFEGENGLYVFSHELMHTVGAIDLYLMNIKEGGNPLTNTTYNNRYNDDIMSSWGTDHYSTYTTELINRETFPPEGLTCFKYQTLNSTFTVLDKNRDPVQGATVSIYRSASTNYRDVEVRTTPAWSGETDTQGALSVTEPLFTNEWGGEASGWTLSSLLLIKTSYKTETFWSWLELSQVNEQYWRGNTKKSSFDIGTNWDMNEIGKEYAAAWTEQTQGKYGTGSPLEVKRGQTIQVLAKFKNAGAATWKNSGKDFVGFYVYKDQIYSTPPEYSNPKNPLFGRSYFANGSWELSYDGSTPFSRAALLKEALVKPGEIGSFLFSFTAPADAKLSAAVDNPKTRYRDDFFREDLTLAYGPLWMKNTVNGDPLGYAHVWFPIKIVP
ncbi:MAG: hypothetical protein WCP97_07380 [bacterium]